MSTPPLSSLKTFIFIQQAGMQVKRELWREREGGGRGGPATDSSLPCFSSFCGLKCTSKQLDNVTTSLFFHTGDLLTASASTPCPRYAMWSKPPSVSHAGTFPLYSATINKREWDDRKWLSKLSGCRPGLSSAELKQTLEPRSDWESTSIRRLWCLANIVLTSAFYPVL